MCRIAGSMQSSQTQQAGSHTHLFITIRFPSFYKRWEFKAIPPTRESRDKASYKTQKDNLFKIQLGVWFKFSFC